MPFPEVILKSIPVVSSQEMFEVDRITIEKFGMSLEKMMENAGRCLAVLTREVILKKSEKKRICVLAGTGGNGGGAITAARRLSIWGYQPYIILTGHPDKMREETRVQLEICRKMQIRMEIANEMANLDLNTREFVCILDGLIGYSLNGAPSGKAAYLITKANASGLPAISLDVPSGYSTKKGKIYSPSIRAHATLTLALPKLGMSHPDARTYSGDLYLADISIPHQVYKTLNLKVPDIFRTGDIVRLV